MKPSIALPHNRLPNAPTPEFSRHILAPLPIPLHTQTSRSSSLPFKPVRLLRAPLAAPPGACCHRSVLPSVALSGNHRPLYFHSPSPPSSKSPDRSLSTTVRSPQPRPNFQLSSGTNLAAPFSLCPRPASPLMRVARPAPPYFSNTRTEHLFIRPARPRLDISPSSRSPVFRFLSHFRSIAATKAGHRAHSANSSITQLLPHRPFNIPGIVVRPVTLCHQPAHRCSPR